MCTKRRYPDQQTAVHELRQFRVRAMMQQRDKLPIRTYRCKLCSAWHITSMRSKIPTSKELRRAGRAR